MRRSYENALKLLATRRRKARPKTPALSPTLQDTGIPNGNQTVRGIPSLVGMKEWLQILGHSESDVNNLNIVHISGTKGKGSTCAFTRSFLHAHGIRTGFPKRIGLYTSPDLQCIRERIQIDNQPITEDLFTQYFFEVWDSLASQGLGQDVETTRQPRYLQFLALLAFHAFIRENVDVAIFETHHGGEYDATNVIPRPVVTGITSLGMDHIEQLGPTIENIAWHKAGILKPEAPAFSVPQEAGPMKVLGDRAAEKKTSLTFISTNNHLPANVRALSAPVQRLNASLAIELARMVLQRKAPGHTIDSDDIARGIDNFSWLGRFETIEDGMSQWFLDGAHNPLSLKQAAEWFSNNIDAQNPRRRRVLIFSHFSEERDGVALMECLAHSLSKYNARPDHVIFTTYQERIDGSSRIDKTIKEPETPFPDLCATYASLWKDFDNQAVVASEPTIEAALNLAKRIGAQEGGVQVFVTGSLHLVGGALNLLRP
ncbi:folylpolyglutamate synthase [Penicillium freii]|nr:folylpolyglutamate synthase [Penicillium freii]